MRSVREGVAVEDRIEAVVGGGFTVLDGAALVIGAAVASVHIRAAVPADGLDGFGWTMLWLTLAGVALTAAGPFVFLVRRYGRRPLGYPDTGDWLWCLLGLPWLLTAVFRPDTRAELWLGLGTTVASLVALGVVWRTWVAHPRAFAPAGGKDAGSWTDRVGMVLSIAWPLQYGFVLVVGS